MIKININDVLHVCRSSFSPVQTFSVAPKQIRDIERRSFLRSEIVPLRVIEVVV